ncbi:MAG: c-type cytochrome [Nitrosomonadales bacterium]|nr:c-type cytochrome [Nitrosomonadales bacterium]
MHKHIVRLLTLIAVVAVVAASARYLARQDTFFQYGHYRGASVAQIAAKLPKHQGSATCEQCHKEIYAEWVGGIHRKATKDNAIQGVVIKSGPGCEVCHTPAGNHPSKEPMPLSTEDQVTTITHKWENHPVNAPGRKLLRAPEDMRLLCANCHEKIPGRPLRGKVAGEGVPVQAVTDVVGIHGVPQIVIEGHGGDEICTNCHNPHSPRINFAAVPRPPSDPNTGKLIPVSAFKSGDANAGKAVAANCGACHGVNGLSVNPEWPNLAGQHADYLVRALNAFKAGARKNDMMSPMATGLSDADMRNVAAYFASASCKSTAADKVKADLGKTKAETAGCAACHSSGGLNRAGIAGVSGAQAWPNLAGQNAAYLTVALKSFRDGSRNHAVMSSVAKTLGDADIENLSAYYASASCK